MYESAAANLWKEAQIKSDLRMKSERNGGRQGDRSNNHKSLLPSAECRPRSRLTGRAQSQVARRPFRSFCQIQARPPPLSRVAHNHGDHFRQCSIIPVQATSWDPGARIRCGAAAVHGEHGCQNAAGAETASTATGGSPLPLLPPTRAQAKSSTATVAPDPYARPRMASVTRGWGKRTSTGMFPEVVALFLPRPGSTGSAALLGERQRSKRTSVTLRS